MWGSFGSIFKSSNLTFSNIQAQTKTVIQSVQKVAPQIQKFQPAVIKKPQPFKPTIPSFTKPSILKSIPLKVPKNIVSNKKTTIQHNPYNYVTVNRFYVELESTLTASFSECSGFGVNLKKEAYLEGGVNHQQRVVVGHAEFDDITLKRGMSDSRIFWDWILNNFNNPKKERRNVNIILFNQAGETMQSWTLIGSIPISWKAPAFQADGSSMAIEELTLAYEGLQLTTSSGAGPSIVQRNAATGFFAPN